MIYENVMLHNIAEAVPQNDGSVALQRVPEEVRQRLETPAQDKLLMPAGAEIRFVVQNGEARVILSAIRLQPLGFSSAPFRGIH